MRSTCLAFGTLCVMLLPGCTTTKEARFESRLLNKAAPDFALTSLDGAKVKLSDFRGKPVVLAFFARGCGPCRAEAPHLSKLAEKYEKDGLVVLAVNFWDEDKEVLAAFAREEKLKQRILLDGSVVGQESYGVQGIPVVYWIDRNGVIVDSHLDSDGPGQLEKKSRVLLGRAG